MANTTNPGHDHPHVAIPVRISKESSFAAPGLETPDKATQQRPARDAGEPCDHPLNRPIETEDKSLIGPQLGVHPLTPVQATETYVDPSVTGKPVEKFEKGADIAAANANFQDVSNLIMRPRGGASNGDRS
jgi:hypothetical protein